MLYIFTSPEAECRQRSGGTPPHNGAPERRRNSASQRRNSAWCESSARKKREKEEEQKKKKAETDRKKEVAKFASEQKKIGMKILSRTTLLLGQLKPLIDHQLFSKIDKELSKKAKDSYGTPAENTTQEMCNF